MHGALRRAVAGALPVPPCLHTHTEASPWAWLSPRAADQSCQPEVWLKTFPSASRAGGFSLFCALLAPLEQQISGVPWRLGAQQVHISTAPGDSRGKVPGQQRGLLYLGCKMCLAISANTWGRELSPPSGRCTGPGPSPGESQP